MTDAQRLKKSRKALGLTQSEMARKMGYYSQTEISKVETGRTSLSGPARKCLEYLMEIENITIKED